MMRTCKEINEIASDYIDGELDFVGKLSVWMHTMICVHCRRYLHQLGLTSDAIKRLGGSEEPSEDEIQSLLNQLRN